MLAGPADAVRRILQEMRAEFAAMRAYMEAARALGEPWLQGLHNTYRLMRALVAETESLLRGHQIYFEAYPEDNPVMVRSPSRVCLSEAIPWNTLGAPFTATCEILCGVLLRDGFPSMQQDRCLERNRWRVPISYCIPSRPLPHAQSHLMHAHRHMHRSGFGCPAADGPRRSRRTFCTYCLPVHSMRSTPSTCAGRHAGGLQHARKKQKTISRTQYVKIPERARGLPDFLTLRRSAPAALGVRRSATAATRGGAATGAGDGRAVGGSAAVETAAAGNGRAVDAEHAVRATAAGGEGAARTEAVAQKLAAG